MHTLCILHLQIFETFKNCCLFCTIWVLRNFYSSDAHHANYDERCSNHTFRHCAHCVYRIYSVLKLFEIAVCFAHLALTKFLLPWHAPSKLWPMLFKSSFPTLLPLCKTPLQCFETFRNCCLFCTFWLLQNFYSGDAHHAKYGERCSNHHFRHGAHCVYHIYGILKLLEIAFFCTFWLLRNFYSSDAHHAKYGKHSLNHYFPRGLHCVYQIYSFLKFFKIAVFFTPFGFYEISTPVMRTMLTTVNVVQIIISDIAHTVFITFKVFWNISKLQLVLHILAFTKSLLRWCAPC